MNDYRLSWSNTVWIGNLRVKLDQRIQRYSKIPGYAIHRLPALNRIIKKIAWYYDSLPYNKLFGIRKPVCRNDCINRDSIFHGHFINAVTRLYYVYNQLKSRSSHSAVCIPTMYANSHVFDCVKSTFIGVLVK